MLQLKELYVSLFQIFGFQFIVLFQIETKSFKILLETFSFFIGIFS